MLKGCEENRGRGENWDRTSGVGGEERRRRIKRKIEDIWRGCVAVDIQATNGLCASPTKRETSNAVCRLLLLYSSVQVLARHVHRFAVLIIIRQWSLCMHQSPPLIF